MTGAGIRVGDVLDGVALLGVATNGYSLARRIAFEEWRLTPDDNVAELGTTVGQALLAPHRSYLRAVSPLLGEGWIKGMAHITGGGLTENVPRMLLRADRRESIVRAGRVPPVFRWLQRGGGVPDDEMFRAFSHMS